jgi:hypothetical protein
LFNLQESISVESISVAFIIIQCCGGCLHRVPEAVSPLKVYLLVTPSPLPPRICKVLELNDLQDFACRIPRKIFMTNNLQTKILKAKDLPADFRGVSFAAASSCAGTMMERFEGWAQG